MSDGAFSLEERPVHLGLGATVVVQEPFTRGMEWYERYGARHASDGAEGRLVSLHTFSEPWATWEMHPRGEELVVCVSGEITLHQELPEGVRTVVLHPGEAIVNPVGVWHTADVDAECRAFFITAGVGTEIRPR
jgi:mannose-6-phosphate isomerase-like protein (cupin superfamily)